MTPTQYEGLYTLIREMPTAHSQPTIEDAPTVGLSTMPIRSRRTERLTKQEREHQRALQLVINTYRRNEAMDLESEYYEAIGLVA